MKYLLLILTISISISTSAQTWVDSIDNFAREVHLPARNYVWNWQNASLLHAMEIQYEMMPEDQQQQYLDYVRIAMYDNFFWANGLLPNYVASGNGMAFMYRITQENRYLESALTVYNDYLNIVRVSNGGVSHLPWTKELWDDTVYMIGVFLIAMYKATGDEEYITQLTDQIRAHQEKLKDLDTGLWVHGWDEDGIYTFDFCSQADWADPGTGRSAELWGRGNGWVVVTLSELLNALPEDHPERDFTATSLLEMIENLPDWQDEATGHWYQLPARPNDEGNFIESSCTAMFGYGILTAIKHDLVDGDEYEQAIRRAYYGLRDHSTFAIDPENPYLNTMNVCAETCIGDTDYYFSREVANGRSYALAMDIIFGRSYEDIYMNDTPTGLVETSGSITSFGIHPNLIDQGSPVSLNLELVEHSTIKMYVTDIAGRLISLASETLSSGAHKIQLAIPDLQKGIYLVYVSDHAGKMAKAKRFMIQ